MLESIRPKAVRSLLLGLVLFAGCALFDPNRTSVAGHAGLTVARVQERAYKSQALEGPSFGLSARLMPYRVSVFADLTTKSLGSRAGRSVTCSFSPAQCGPTFPDVHGWNYTTGLFIHPNRSFEARLGLGLGHYVTRDEEALYPGAIAWLADVTAYPVSHVGLALALEDVKLDRYVGNRLSLQSLSFAIRLR